MSVEPGAAREQLRYAYNTNGTAHHRLDEAIYLISEAGYDGVALTLDTHHLYPFADDVEDQTDRCADLLASSGLASVVETGGRFLLDPRAKHEPTLVTATPEGRDRRLRFLRHAVGTAALLGSECVSFWAGVPRGGVTVEQAWPWLVDGVCRLVDHAGERDVVLAFEPEPGMLVEDVAGWVRLRDEVRSRTGDDGTVLRLALDTGHCVVAGGVEPQDAVHDHADELGTVAVEGMARGVHDHLPLDEGDVDLPAVLAALTEVGYARLVSVELSRDSHRADVMVPRALATLRAAERGTA